MHFARVQKIWSVGWVGLAYFSFYVVSNWLYWINGLSRILLQSRISFLSPQFDYLLTNSTNLDFVRKRDLADLGNTNSHK